MYSGMNRRKFSSGAMAMIVVNKDYVIEDCYILKGISVFSKFKKYEKYIGHHVAKILDDHHEFTENAAGKRGKSLHFWRLYRWRPKMLSFPFPRKSFQYKMC